MFRTLSLNRMLILFVGAGFLFLLTDSILEHSDVLLKDLPAWIPVLFSALGLTVSVAALVRWNERRLMILNVTFYAAFLVALGGVYFHTADEDDDELTTQEEETGEREKEKPLLAPLSFAGLAAFGLLGTSRRWRSQPDAAAA